LRALSERFKKQKEKLVAKVIYIEKVACGVFVAVYIVAVFILSFSFGYSASPDGF